MGYGGVKKEINSTVQEITENMRAQAQKLIKAQCIYELVPVKIMGTNQILLDGRFTLPCVDKFFQGATHAAVGVTTAGPKGCKLAAVGATLAASKILSSFSSSTFFAWN